MERDRFQRDLQGVLLRFYDRPQPDAGSALAKLVTQGASASAADWRQAILDAIERLKPPSGLPVDSRPSRNYNYLIQRYIQLRNVKEISRDFGISERQSQRVNAEAIEALADDLWSSLFDRSGPAAASRPAPVRDRPESDGLGPDIARREVARLAGSSDARPVHLKDVLAGVLETAANMVSDRSTPVTVDLPADLPSVIADRTMLRQGLLCLLVACIDSGASDIRFVADPSPEGVDMRLIATIGLADGAGSSPRRDVSQHRSLSLAAEILRSQNCYVELLRQTDSVITIDARFRRTEVPCVLVVDDNPDTIRLYRRYLANQSFRVLDAQSGARAFDLARENHPLAITLDVMMPGQDGWETLQKLHNHPDTRDIPVIICSVVDQRDLALSLGAADLLPKPVSRSALLKALARCLESPAKR